MQAKSMMISQSAHNADADAPALSPMKADGLVAILGHDTLGQTGTDGNPENSTMLLDKTETEGEESNVMLSATHNRRSRNSRKNSPRSSRRQRLSSDLTISEADNTDDRGSKAEYHLNSSPKPSQRQLTNSRRGLPSRSSHSEDNPCQRETVLHVTDRSRSHSRSRLRCPFLSKSSFCPFRRLTPLLPLLISLCSVLDKNERTKN